MSFVVWLYTLFLSAWTSSARLGDFVHAIDVSLALSLAYSIILKLGNLSGHTLDLWVEREKARVIGPLAENKDFDADGHEQILNNCRSRFSRFVFWSNAFFMAWCVVAAFLGLAALILIPFHEETIVEGPLVMESAGLLAGPVPLGMLTLFIAHISARLRMRYHSKDAEVLIRMLARKRAKDLAAAKKALSDGTPANIVQRASDWIELYWPDIKLWSKWIFWASVVIIAARWFFTH